MAVQPRVYWNSSFTIGRILFVVATVIFVMAAFAASGDFTGAKWSTLLAVGLAVGFAGMAIG